MSQMSHYVKILKLSRSFFPHPAFDFFQISFIEEVSVFVAFDGDGLVLTDGDQGITYCEVVFHRDGFTVLFVLVGEGVVNAVTTGFYVAKGDAFVGKDKIVNMVVAEKHCAATGFKTGIKQT